MGIEERLLIPPLPDSTHSKALRTLDKVFEGLNRQSGMDYLISGNRGNRQFFLHPLRDGRFDYIEMLSLGIVLEQSLKEGFPTEQVSVFPGTNSSTAFRFPAFSIIGKQDAISLSGIIYPTQEYAREIYETDVLEYESSTRVSLSLSKSLLVEVEARRKGFPKFEIP